MAGQKEAYELRTRLQELERAQRDTRRKLQERHKQVRGHPPTQAPQPMPTCPVLLPSSCLLAILDISFLLTPFPWSDTGQSHSPGKSHS